MRKCHICGMIKSDKNVIKCHKCNAYACITCFHIEQMLCFNCIEKNYEFNYYHTPISPVKITSVQIRDEHDARIHISFYALMLISMLLLPSALATMYRFSPIEDSNGTDTFIENEAGATNYGGSNYICYGKTGAFTYRGLITWNYTCASIPSTDTIKNVTMEFYVFRKETDDASVHPMNASFDENTVTWNNCGAGGCLGKYNASINLTLYATPYADDAMGNVTIEPSWYSAMCAKPPAERYGLLFAHESVQANTQCYYSSNNAPIPALYVETGSPPSVSFSSFAPYNLSIENLAVIYNSTYTMNAGSEALKASQYLYIKTNSSLLDYSIFTSGNPLTGWLRINYTNSSGANLYSWLLDDNNIYPASYNYNNSYMQYTEKTAYALSGFNHWSRIEFLNVSPVNYTIHEIMTNGTGIFPLVMYYCNVSYTTGNPTSSNFCYPFYTLTQGILFNHTHRFGFSKHHIIPLSVNKSGYVGNVKVTSNSSILYQGRAATTWYLWGIPKTNRNSSYQTSTDDGTTWASTGITIDAHMHQITGTEQFHMIGEVCDTSNICANSSISSKKFNLTFIPPLPPVVYWPSNETPTITSGVYVNYTAAVPQGLTSITKYSIWLLNGSYDEHAELTADNGLALFYLASLSAYPSGTYAFKVTAFDSDGSSSFGLSSNFTLNSSTAAGSLYSFDYIKPTNWFNTDIIDMATTAGVLILFFLFIVLVGMVTLAEYTKIPFLVAVSGIYGFFLGILIYSAISAILGIIFTILSCLYAIRSMQLALQN